jgi:hypothetical protein
MKRGPTGMSAEPKTKSILFPVFLGAVTLLFIGLLVYTWVGAEQANPVILDEKGRPRGAQTK